MELSVKAKSVKAKSEAKFGNKFTLVDMHLYKDNKSKITIICPEHGSIETTMANHLRSEHGCKECGLKISSEVEQGGSLEEKQIKLIDSIEKIFGKDHYDLSKINYVSNRTLVELLCELHGTFYKTPEKLKSGQGCQECAKVNSSSWGRKIMTIDDVIMESNRVHGTGRYLFKENVEIKSTKTKIPIYCTVHETTFYQEICNHITMGQGCKQCGIERTSVKNMLDPQYIFDCLVEACGDDYSFDFDVDYIKNNKIKYDDKLDFICNQHKVSYSQSFRNRIYGCGCPMCSGSGSSGENKLFEFIKSIYGGEIIRNDRKSLKPQHIDIFIPELKIGFEYNGIYWHSDKHRSRSYHEKKVRLADSKNIRLINIWEDEWVLQNDKVKDFVSGLLLNNQKRHYARKLSVGKPSKEDQKKFFNDHHFQGFSGNTFCLGLYDGNDLIQSMTLKLIDVDKKIYEIGRLATKRGNVVIGGSKRLFNNILKNLDFSEIISYNNLDKFSGMVYRDLGMKFVCESRSHNYYKGLMKYSWMKINSLYKDENKSIDENAKELGYLRVFTAGNSKYSYKNPKNVETDTN